MIIVLSIIAIAMVANAVISYLNYKNSSPIYLDSEDAGVEYMDVPVVPVGTSDKEYEEALINYANPSRYRRAGRIEYSEVEPLPEDIDESVEVIFEAEEKQLYEKKRGY